MKGIKFNPQTAWDQLQKGYFDNTFLEQFFADFTALDIIIKDKKKVESLLRKNFILLKYIDSKNKSWNEIHLLILNCYDTIFSKLKEENHPIDTKCTVDLKSCIFETLRQLPVDRLDKKYVNKMIKVCLRLLRSTIDEESVSNSEEFQMLLGVVQAYLFYGLQDFPAINPKPMVTCNLNLPVDVNPELKKKYFRNYKTKKPIPTKSAVLSPNSKSPVKATSDSEVSDNESRSKADVQDHSIRLEAIHLFNYLVICNKEQFSSYWMQIIASGSNDNLRTLAKYIVHETVQGNLRVALNTLHELLLGSKTFLSHANNIERSSYDSVFYLLGLSIKEIYESIYHLLRKEKRLIVLIKAIKCASSLVQTTPFSKLKPGLATELARLCYPFLPHIDNTVRVITYELFETLILSEPVTEEIKEIFSKPLSDSFYKIPNPYITASESDPEEIVIDDMNDLDLGDDEMYPPITKMGAIMTMCLNNITTNRNKEPVIVRALMLLRAIAFNAFDFVYPYLEFVIDEIIMPAKSATNRDIDDLWRIILQSFRTIEVIAQRLKDVKYNKKAPEFWKMIFSDVIRFASTKISNLREVACDCLANMENNTLLQQEKIDIDFLNSRYLVSSMVTVLSECINDRESAVRAAAVRAFGMLVTLPALEEDTGFLWDVQKYACTAYVDKNLGVRIKAAWAIANLTDVLIKRKQEMNIPSKVNELEGIESSFNADDAEPVDFINILAEPYLLSVSGTKDKDKVRCNAVKAIGNIIYLCQDIDCIKDTSSDIIGNDMYNFRQPPEYLTTLKELLHEIRSDVKKSLTKDILEYFNPTDRRYSFYKNILILRYTTLGLNALINCLKESNDKKVKWNTCRALGVIISGDPDAILARYWKDIVFPILTEQMCKSDNFKVRINAAWVFTVCKSFDDKINMVWKNILEAFENSKTISSINEYKHYEDLEEQLCLAFCHVALFTDYKYFDSLWAEIENYMDNVTPTIKRFQEKVLPEKAGDLMKVKTRFSLLTEKEMTPNEKKFVTKMIDLFKNEDRFNSEIGVECT